MAGGDHHLVDALEHLGGEQAQVVFERLHAPARLIGPVAVPEHLPNGAMGIGQLLDAIIVGVQPQAQRPQHQNLPLRHARASGLAAHRPLAIGPPRQHLRQDRKHRLSQLGCDVDVLQPAQ